jgi:hypothetical protein
MREEATGGRRQSGLHNEELYNLHFSQNIIRITTWRNMRGEDMGNAYKTWRDETTLKTKVLI